MKLHVGQKVVCVNDAIHGARSGGYWERPVRKGQIYTIRECGIRTLDGFPGVRLEEVYRRDPNFPDAPLWSNRFRPVKTTDISIFTKMLAPTPKEREPA